ncbi:MAG: DNA mismatch repair endonuclease MutL [Anaerolineales bacterium]|nr:DNA mismatch repair endonuclease MutL [Anaerolineales bacterium]
MPIRVLPDEVSSQIAAGEVVERPASVVKELMENALDAGATYITIAIEGAGKQLIEVADDGSGIPASELPLALKRHATSKLSSAEDLFCIETLGFRGEALASIGSVSRLRLTSRPKGADIGLRIQVEGGQVEPPQPIGAPGGTVVRVEDLFFNVPARKKFLKTDRTERRQIDMLVTRYALAYPQVRFQLRQENRQSLQTSGNGDRREVLANLYGVEMAKQMIEVLSGDEDLKITGYISPTALTRSNRKEIVFFVNGRPIQDSALSTAVIQAYHTMLMVGRYPMAVLFVDISPQAVDVNVHPAKAEVRFRDRDQVFRAVGMATRRALLAHTPVPGVDGIGQQIRWSPNWGRDAIPRESEDDPAWGMTSDDAYRPGSGQNAETVDQKELPRVTIPLLRLVGQVATAYLIAEGPDGLYLIDQHAAHERVLFEHYMAQRRDSIPSQTLLEPVTVDLPPASARLLDEQLDLLGRLGFQVESFGPGVFRVRAIPVLLSGMNPAAALSVLVEDFEEDESPLVDEIEAKIIARVCKRAAVKAGQTLSFEEQSALLRDLEACQSPRTCPHGRPTMIHLSVDLLERQFGRRGAIT